DVGAEPADELPGGRVPQPDAAVADRDEALAVGGEGDVVDAVVVRLGAAGLLAGGGVPEADVAVLPAGGEHLPIGAEGDGEDGAPLLEPRRPQPGEDPGRQRVFAGRLGGGRACEEEQEARGRKQTADVREHGDPPRGRLIPSVRGYQNGG